MEQLKKSIKETDGPIDPLMVKDLGKGEYVVVSGETRLKALIELGYPPDYKVPCLVDEFSDEKALEYALIENFVRQPLTPYEEALVVKTLIEGYRFRQKDLAQRLGKNKQYVTNLLGIFRLIEGVQEALHQGKITLEHAKSLYPLRDSLDLQEKVLNEVLARNLNVEETKTRVKELSGEGKNWFIKPGTVWVSKNSRVSLHPVGRRFKLYASFGSKEELGKIMKIIKNRIKK
jgi:ParB family chromosome partitioning protein